MSEVVSCQTVTERQCPLLVKRTVNMSPTVRDAVLGPCKCVCRTDKHPTYHFCAWCGDGWTAESPKEGLT